MASRAPPTPTPTITARAIASVIGLFVVGGSCSTCATAVLVPEGGVWREGRARHNLAQDTAAALRVAAELEDGGAPDDNGIGALARVLLWLEHGGADSDRAAGEKLLQKASAAGRTSPEALYARALLVASGNSDPTLSADLAKAPESGWTLLAQAADASKPAEERLALTLRASLAPAALAHATHQLARRSADVDVPLARASLDRLARLAPNHAPGAVTEVALALLEERLPDAQRRRRPERKKGEGPPVPGQAQRSPEETRLLELHDATSSPEDHGLLSLVAVALAFGRGEEPVGEHLQSVVERAGVNVDVAQRALEVAVLVGDVELADRLAATQKTIDRPELLVLVSRARFLRAVPEAERRAALKAERSVGPDGIVLPLGALRLDLTRASVPWRAVLSPTFFPERRYQRLLTELASGGTRERLDQRLQAIEKLGLADRAIAGGDTTTALTLLAEARGLAGQDADAALVEAAIRSRQGDKVGVRTAVEAALAVAPLDPHVLLSGARLNLEADNVLGARTALSAFGRLGLRSAQASALLALLEAREGDVTNARAALADARRLGGEGDVLTLRAAVLTNRQADVADARASAKALLDKGDGGGNNDIVAAWIAEAAYRQGDRDRAESALKAIRAARPALGEPHLFYAQTLRFNRARRAEAMAAAVLATKQLEKGPLLDEARQLVAALKKQR